MASAIFEIGSRNLAATSATSSVPARLDHAARRSAKLGAGTSITNAVPSPRAATSARRGRAHDQPPVASAQHPQPPAHVRRGGIVEAGVTQHGALEGGPQPRLGHQLALAGVVHIDHQHRALRRDRHQLDRVGPAHDHRQRALICEQAAKLGDRVGAAEIVAGR